MRCCMRASCLREELCSLVSLFSPFPLLFLYSRFLCARSSSTPAVCGPSGVRGRAKSETSLVTLSNVPSFFSHAEGKGRRASHQGRILPLVDITARRQTSGIVILGLRLLDTFKVRLVAETVTASCLSLRVPVPSSERTCGREDVEDGRSVSTRQHVCESKRSPRNRWHRHRASTWMNCRIS